MANPSEQAGGNTSTENTEEDRPWDEVFVNNPDEYFGNTNSKQESRPKIGDPKEVALHTYVTDNKYNENRTVRYNMQQLEAMLEHPFAELIIKTPSYEDAQHFYNEGNYTAFTDSQHDAINDLERFTSSFIVKRCESILEMMPQKYQLNSENIRRKIYKLFTLSPKRLDLQEIKSYYPDGKFEITDPWSTPNMGPDKINAICHPGVADILEVKASERAYWGTTGRGSAAIEGHTSTDALDHLYWVNDLEGNNETRGIFRVQNKRITHNQPHLANYMLYFLIVNEHLLDLMIKFYKYPLRGKQESRSRKNDGHLKTYTWWVSKANADGPVTDIEGVVGAITGYELTRGVAWRKAFSTKVTECSTPAMRRHCDLNNNIPPGWDLRSSHSNYGNVLTRMTYSYLQKRLAYELKTFCDKGDHKGIGAQLVCWKRIKDIFNNPLIPNQYYATHELLKVTCDLDLTTAIMDAKNAFKKLQYRRGHWVHDYLRGLLQYKEDMAHVGVEITDEELMNKFKEEVIPKHELKSGNTDSYEQAIHDLVDTKLRMDRGQDIGIDGILKQAWQSIDDMITHTNRLYVNHRARGINRKPAPVEWHRHLVNEPNHDRVFKNHRNEAELELDEDEAKPVAHLNQTQQRAIHARRGGQPPPFGAPGNRGSYYQQYKKQQTTGNAKKSFQQRMGKLNQYKRNQHGNSGYPLGRVSRVPPTDRRIPANDELLHKQRLAVNKLESMINSQEEPDPDLMNLYNDLTNYRNEMPNNNPLGFEPDPPQETSREEDTHSDDDEAAKVYAMIERDHQGDPEAIAEACEQYLAEKSLHETGAHYENLDLFALRCLNVQCQSDPPKTSGGHDTIQDTGATLGITDRRLLNPVPGCIYELRKPVIISQGKGIIKIKQIALNRRTFTDYRSPDKVFEQVAPTLVYDADQEVDIASVRQQTVWGVGLDMKPKGNGGVNNGHDELYNVTGSVRIRLYHRSSGVPIAYNIGPEAASKYEPSQRIDFYTGNLFNLKKAVQRCKSEFLDRFLEAYEGGSTCRYDSLNEQIMNYGEMGEIMAHVQRVMDSQTEETYALSTCDINDAYDHWCLDATSIKQANKATLVDLQSEQPELKPDAQVMATQLQPPHDDKSNLDHSNDGSSSADESLPYLRSASSSEDESKEELNSQQADLRPAQSSNVVVTNGIVGKYEKILALKKLDRKKRADMVKKAKKEVKAHFANMTSTKTVDDDLGTVKTTANPVASRRVLSKEDTRKIFQVSDEKRVKPPTRKVPISKAFELTSPSTRDINPQVYNGNPSSPHYHYHYNLLLYGTRGDKHKSRAMIKDLLSQRDLNFAQREQLEKLRKRATFRRDHSNRCKTAAKLDSSPEPPELAGFYVDSVFSPGPSASRSLSLSKIT